MNRLSQELVRIAKSLEADEKSVGQTEEEVVKRIGDKICEALLTSKIGGDIGTATVNGIKRFDGTKFLFKIVFGNPLEDEFGCHIKEVTCFIGGGFLEYEFRQSCHPGYMKMEGEPRRTLSDSGIISYEKAFTLRPGMGAVDLEIVWKRVNELCEVLVRSLTRWARTHYQ